MYLYWLYYPTANNFDATANLDTDPTSCTYDVLCLQDGDANYDNTVDLSDLLLVLNNWLQGGTVGANGDVCGSLDGQVNLDDLLLVLNNWLLSTSAATPSVQQRNSTPSTSSFVGLTLEEIDNSDGIFNNSEKTYRLYANFNSSSAKLLAIFGDEMNPYLIETSTIFYQDQMAAANLQQTINPAFIGSGIPGTENMQYDSWLTIGDNYNPSQYLSSIGELNWSAFSGNSWYGGLLVDSDASLYRIPTDPECLPNSNNKILLGQFTTNGIISGYINLAGLNPDGTPWKETNISIPSNQTTSIFDGEIISDLLIYPNPTNSILNINFFNNRVNDVTIKVINSIGEVVYMSSLDDHYGKYDNKIDLSEYSKGLYVLEINTTENTIIKKISLY